MLSAMNALDMVLHKTLLWQIINCFYNNKSKIKIFTTASECVLIFVNTCPCNCKLSTCVSNLTVTVTHLAVGLALASSAAGGPREADRDQQCQSDHLPPGTSPADHRRVSPDRFPRPSSWRPAGVLDLWLAQRVAAQRESSCRRHLAAWLERTGRGLASPSVRYCGPAGSFPECSPRVRRTAPRVEPRRLLASRPHPSCRRTGAGHGPTLSWRPNSRPGPSGRLFLLPC